MDEDEFGAGPSEWFRKCLCKKVFHQLNSYTTHIKSCQQYKTSAGATLQEAKIRYRARKSKSGKNREAPKSWDDDDDLGIDYIPPIPPGPSSASEGQTPQAFVQAEAEILLTPDGPPCVRQPCLSPSPQLFIPRSLSLEQPPANLAAALPESPHPMEIDVEAPVTEYGRGHRTRTAVQHFKDFAATSTIPFDIPSTQLDIENELDPPPADTPTPPPQLWHLKTSKLQTWPHPLRCFEGQSSMCPLGNPLH
jgi:hypothetical protein